MTQTTQKKQISISLKPQFVMSKKDKETLDNLPDNLPDTALTEKQKKVVNYLYHKYISQNQVTYGWGNDLYLLEQKEKWPSGSKVKTHEAKRMILGWLRTYNVYYGKYEGKKALEFLLNELTCREADQILVKNIYQID